MIDFQEYKKWEDDPKSKVFGMISVGYNQSIKRKILDRNCFELENKTINKNHFVKILFDVCVKFVGKKFIARLYNEELSWIVSYDDSDFTLKQLYWLKGISKYLKNKKWSETKFKGTIEVKDLRKFLSIFISYPLEFEYQPIFLNSLISEMLIIISDHGTVWFVGKDKHKLMKIAEYLDSKGATVIFSKPFFNTRQVTTLPNDAI